MWTQIQRDRCFIVSSLGSGGVVLAVCSLGSGGVVLVLCSLGSGGVELAVAVLESFSLGSGAKAAL